MSVAEDLLVPTQDTVQAKDDSVESDKVSKDKAFQKIQEEHLRSLCHPEDKAEHRGQRVYRVELQMMLVVQHVQGIGSLVAPLILRHKLKLQVSFLPYTSTVREVFY